MRPEEVAAPQPGLGVMWYHLKNNGLSKPRAKAQTSERRDESGLVRLARYYEKK